MYFAKGQVIKIINASRVVWSLRKSLVDWSGGTDGSPHTRETAKLLAHLSHVHPDDGGDSMRAVVLHTLPCIPIKQIRGTDIRISRDCTADYATLAF